MQYGLILTKSSDRELQIKVLFHEAFMNLYNIITSYKFLLTNMLNDGMIYSHFNHFYLTKYLSSSDRSLTIEQSLQLQGFKPTSIKFYSNN